MLKLTTFPAVGKDFFYFKYFKDFQKIIADIRGIRGGSQQLIQVQGSQQLGQSQLLLPQGYQLDGQLDNFNAIREALHLDFIENESVKQMTRLNKDSNRTGDNAIQYAQHKLRIQEQRALHDELVLFILVLLQRIMWRQQPNSNTDNQVDYTYVPISSAIGLIKQVAGDIMKLHDTILDIKFSSKDTKDIIKYQDNLADLTEKAEFGDLIKVQPEKQLKEIKSLTKGTVQKKKGRKTKVI